ncbi:MAG: cell division protein ZipA [Pseudomonadota bacterium]
MELRTILIVVAVLVIAALLADGARRMFRARKAPAPNMKSPRVEVPDFNPELPGGGARVRRREPVVGREPQGGEPVAVAQEPAPVVRRIEQTDMFGDVEIPAAEPAPAREIQSRGELPRREPPLASQQREREAAARAEEKARRQQPEEVIVVHVMGGDRRLVGKPLLQAVLDCGLRFGEYNIFHRYESGAHDAQAMFSMANAVEPGVFDLDTMEGLDFVGVSFFLMLPGPGNSRQALDLMIEAARRVARDTGGEMHDQQHSVLTPQTIEHLRQRVMEFERRRAAQQRANG